jgi:hypothetical protein
MFRCRLCFPSDFTKLGALGVRKHHVLCRRRPAPAAQKNKRHVVEATKAAGIDVSFTTDATVVNAEFIDRSLPLTSWMKVSINAGTEETYAKVHRTKEKDFQRVIGNLKQAVAAKRAKNLNCVIGVQALLLPENAHEMEQLAQICRDEAGSDYLVIKPYSQHMFSDTRLYQGIDYSAHMALAEQLQKLNTDDFHVVFRENTMKKTTQTDDRYSKCNATPFFWAYIMADGDVYGCSAYLMDEKEIQ